MGDCPGPRKETTTRRTVTQGGRGGALSIGLRGWLGGCNITAADLTGLRSLSHSTCRANAIARNKETWCQRDTVLSLGPRLIQPLVTAEPKGAYGTTDEGFLVLTCACSHHTSPYGVLPASM